LAVDPEDDVSLLDEEEEDPESFFDSFDSFDSVAPFESAESFEAAVVDDVELEPLRLSVL
jgi:hypothetical protein